MRQTVEDFRVVRTNANGVSNTRKSDLREDRIRALYKGGKTVDEIVRLTYSGQTMPERDSPASPPTGFALASLNRYRERVCSILGIVEGNGNEQPV